MVLIVQDTAIPRMKALAAQMRWHFKYARATVEQLWTNSQSAGVWEGSAEDIVFWCDESEAEPAIQTRLLESLQNPRVRFIRWVSDDRYRICGNEDEVKSTDLRREVNRENALQGWKKRKAAIDKAKGNGQAECDSHSDPLPDPHSDSHSGCDSHSDPHSDSECDSHSDPLPDPHSDSHSGCDSHSDPHSDPHSDSECDSHSDPLPDPHSDSHSDSRGCDSHSDPHSDSECDSHSETDANRNATGMPKLNQAKPSFSKENSHSLKKERELLETRARVDPHDPPGPNPSVAAAIAAASGSVVNLASSRHKQTAPTGKPEARTGEPTYVDDDDLAAQDRQLAESMLRRVKALNPHLLEASAGRLGEWVATLRAMREEDGLTHDQLANALMFTLRDQEDQFWRFKVVSPMYLREHWESIAAQMQEARYRPRKAGFRLC